MASADVELPLTLEVLDIAGTPGYLAPVNDTDPNAVYSGSHGASAGGWSTTTGTFFEDNTEENSTGDLLGDYHSTTSSGDQVTFKFTGTGVQVMGETSPGFGTFDVYVDGTKRSTGTEDKGTVTLSQQYVANVTGLSKGPHTLTLVSTSSSNLVIDGFQVIPDVMAPVHNITFSGITFTGTTWNQPTTEGCNDSQGGFHADPATLALVASPGGVQVHRGNLITFTGDTFTHTGTSGIQFTDGTQNSTAPLDRSRQCARASGRDRDGRRSQSRNPIKGCAWTLRR